MAVTFEWDESKAVTNQQKHGVSFEEAVTVFETNSPLPSVMWSIPILRSVSLTSESPAVVVSWSSSTLNETKRFASVAVASQQEPSGERMNDDRRSSVGEQGHEDDVVHTVNTDSDANDSDLAAEYEFSRGERGKHALAMRAGYSMVIHRSDGTTETRELTPRPGIVVLDPDVRTYFPDSDAVNRALRGLIRLLPPHSAPTESR